MEYRLLNVYDTYVPAHIDMGRLQADGIDCWLKDENTVTMNPVLGSAVGGIKLMVAVHDYDQARGILTSLLDSYRQTIPCPVCGSHNVDLVSTPRNLANLFTAIATWAMGTNPVATKDVFHCFNCNHEFKEAAVPTDTGKDSTPVADS